MARYVGLKKEVLYNYIAKVAADQVKSFSAASSTASSSKPNNRKSPSPSSSVHPTPAASPNHSSYMNSMMANSYGASSSPLHAQSLVKPKKSNQQQQQQPTANSSGGGGAINLCTNNQTTSYGEGLAGKLMAPSSSEQASSLLPPSRKSSVRFSYTR